MKLEYELFNYLNELQKTKRFGIFDEVFHESVPEHTYKMILMIDRLFDKLELDLDYRKCIKLTLYHDICEIDLENDFDAYLTSQNDEMKSNKKELEHKKVQEISKKYQDEAIYELFKEYEDQITKEAKFIKAIDKLETTIRCIVGTKHAKLVNPEFTALYCEPYIKEFPELKPLYKIVKAKLKERYAEWGWEWKAEYDAIFK